MGHCAPELPWKLEGERERCVHTCPTAWIPRRSQGPWPPSSASLPHHSCEWPNTSLGVIGVISREYEGDSGVHLFQGVHVFLFGPDPCEGVQRAALDVVGGDARHGGEVQVRHVQLKQLLQHLLVVYIYAVVGMYIYCYGEILGNEECGDTRERKRPTHTHTHTHTERERERERERDQ